MGEREVREHDLPERPLTDRARALVDEAEVTDRASRFTLRHEAVSEAKDRRRRRQRVVWATLAVLVALLAAVVGVALAGPAGVAAGALGGLVPGLRWGLDRAARGRGASAWDWRTQRHVLTSNPAREVQEWDAPNGR